MIMKKILYFALIALMAIVSSCLDRAEIQTYDEGDLTLDLVFGTPQTRSTTVGTDAENAIKSVDYFFFADKSDNQPVFKYRDASPVVTNGKYTVSLTAGGRLGDKTVPDLDVLFKDKKTYFFAVFNSPEEIASQDLASIKQIAVANSFSYDAREEGANDPVWTVTPDDDPAGHEKVFVMTGEQELTRSGNAKVTGTVNMTRLAAKVCVKLQIDKVVNIGTVASPNNWRPLIGRRNVRLYLCNYVQNSVIGSADATPSYPTSYTQADYMPYVVNTDSPEDDDSGNKFVFDPQQDYCTYPIEWTPGADTEPFIKLVLPWYPESGAVPSKELYYKIMFPKSITKLEANKYYQLTANITFLGNEGEPTIELTAQNAQVVGWGDSDKVNPVIKAAKYLSVQKDFVKYFTVSSGVSFSASDPASLEIINVYHTDLKTGNNEYIVQDGELKNNVRTDLGTKSWITDDNGLRIGLKVGNNNWILLNNTVNYIQAGHQLDQSLTSQYMDVTPWTYEVMVHLGPNTSANSSTYNDISYIRSIIFEQWPEVYVVEDENRGLNTTGGVYVNGSTSTTTTWSHGYSYGGNYSDYYINNGTYNLGGVHGLTGNNTNGSMYVLTIGVSGTYMIGDPRSSTIDNYPEFYSSDSEYYYSSNKYNNFVNSYATWNSGTNNTLSHYHPTSSTNTATMIAPKIRIASSYGVCTTGRSEDEAKYRCASYQEDGIPAGRWRLPTLAEVQFISTLSSLGRIPYLFGLNSSTQSSNSYYWTANGLIRVNNGSNPPVAEKYTGSTNNISPSVRCVYDEWFWGDATSSRPVQYNRFTWGDKDY